MRDRNVEDISCDGPGVPVFVYHRRHRDLETNVVFEEEELNSFVVRAAQQAGKHVSVANPLVDASLADGSRVQLTLGREVSSRGSNFTVRRFADVPATPVDLVEWNTFSTETMAYLWLALENDMSMLFAGGTASGKTTSLNASALFIPRKSKVISIEDTREITLPHQNWIQSVTRPGFTDEGRGEVNMYNLLQAALRQRPEYLLVGEVRTESNVALTFFQAMSTGHTACTTFHADSVSTVLSRLENPPLSVPSQMIQELDVVCVQRQTFLDDSRVRRNVSITEIDRDPESDEVHTNELFRWNPTTDTFERQGQSGKLEQIRQARGWTAGKPQTELRRREQFLDGLVERGIREYEVVTDAIEQFQRNPKRALQRLEAGEFDAGTAGPDPTPGQPPGESG